MTTIDVVTSDAELVAAIGDAVDAGEAYRIPETVFAALQASDPRPPQVVLDLAGVTFMDSTGLAMLLRTEQEVRELGSSLALRNPSEPVRRLLAITALDTHFVTA